MLGRGSGLLVLHRPLGTPGADPETDLEDDHGQGDARGDERDVTERFQSGVLGYRDRGRSPRS